MITTDFHVTFGQLRNMLNDAAKEDPDMDDCIILWAEVVQKDGKLQKEKNLCPGTVLLGLCYDEDDCGTLRIAPGVIGVIQ